VAKRRPAADQGPCQPVIEPIGLTRTPQGAKVLREGDRDRHVGVLGPEWREERCVGRAAVLGPLQHQASGATRGQRLLRHLHDAREGVAWALLARLQPLRLAQTLGLTRHRRVAAGVALASEVPTQR
jgi:hypothetical protein